MIQEDGAVHANAFDTFVSISPAAPTPTHPYALQSWYKHLPSDSHRPDLVQSSPPHTNADARFSANITARINRLTPNRNIKQQNLKRWNGREWRKAVQLRRGKGEEGTPMPLIVIGLRHCPPSQGDLSPSCHPSSFVCAAVLLAGLHSSHRRGTLLSSPLALKSKRRAV